MKYSFIAYRVVHYRRKHNALKNDNRNFKCQQTKIIHTHVYRYRDTEYLCAPIYFNILLTGFK